MARRDGAFKARYFADARHVDKKMPTDPDVIFFDAADTLIYLPKSVGEHYREVSLRFGVAPDASALDRAFRAAWKAAPERTTTDGPRPEDDKGWWRGLVGSVFEAVLTPAELEQFDLHAYFEEVYAHFAEPGVWAAYADVHDSLSLLREERYRLGVISNFDGRLRKVLHDLALAPFFEHVIISSEVGADKPDQRIFAKALELFGVTPDRAWHVGDNPQKDGDAAAAGLRVFRLERPRHTLRDVLMSIRQAPRS